MNRQRTDIWFCDTRSFHKHSQRNSQRTGFTLFEVLLATLIGLILIASIYGSLSLVMRTSTIGNAKRERNHIARAIFLKMSAEFQNIIFMPKSPEQAIIDSLETALEELDSSTETIQVTDKVTSETQGLYGDSTTLVLHLAHQRSSRELGPVLFDDPEWFPGGSHHYTVTWFLTGSNSGSLQTSVAARFQNRPGLIRMMGSYDRFQTLDEAGNYDEMASYAQHLAVEVHQLQFRYFDGYSWFDEWNSSETNSLPQAVEVSMSLSQTKNNSQQNLSQTSNFSALSLEDATTYRMVFPVLIQYPSLESKDELLQETESSSSE